MISGLTFSVSWRNKTLRSFAGVRSGEKIIADGKLPSKAKHVGIESHRGRYSVRAWRTPKSCTLSSDPQEDTQAAGHGGNFYGRVARIGLGTCFLNRQPTSNRCYVGSNPTTPTI